MEDCRLVMAMVVSTTMRECMMLVAVVVMSYLE